LGAFSKVGKEVLARFHPLLMTLQEQRIGLPLLLRSSLGEIAVSSRQAWGHATNLSLPRAREAKAPHPVLEAVFVKKSPKRVASGKFFFGGRWGRTESCLEVEGTVENKAVPYLFSACFSEHRPKTAGEIFYFFGSRRCFAEISKQL